MLDGLEVDCGLAESRLLMRRGSTVFPSGLPEEVVVELLTGELSRNSSPSGWRARLLSGSMILARRESKGRVVVAECTAEERCTVPITELDAPIGVIGVVGVVVWSVRGRAGTRGLVVGEKEE